MIALYDKVLGGPVFLDHGVDRATVVSNTLLSVDYTECFAASCN